MTTTIKELTYLLIDMSEGGQPTDDARLNYRVAKAYIKSAVAYQLRKRWFEDKNNSDENYIGKTTTKDAELIYDEEEDSYYIETLGESIDMGGMRSYSVTSKKSNSRWAIRFVPITLSEWFSQKGLIRIPNVIQYYLKGDRLYFTNGIPEDLDIVQLTQSNLLPSDDDDSVPADVGQEALRYAWMLAYPEVSMPTDRENDGVDRKTN